MRQGLFDNADLPLETAILLIAGMTALLSGALLFPANAGVLPYYENGLHGLILFFFALQTVLLGKTPFGDLPVSGYLLAAGVLVAAAGIATCVVPSVPADIVRMLLFVCLAPGGALLLAQMLLSPRKLRLWLRLGGVLRPLVFGCASVYLLSTLLGALLFVEPRASVRYATAAVLLLQGAAILNLVRILIAVYREYPEASGDAGARGGLPFDRAMLLLTGVFMILLGVLLLPVNLGLLPFSGSAQLGLLMVIFAVQMLAAGSTPIGAFPRTRPILLLGLLFAGLGIVSCILPEILVGPLTLLVGVLNILNGGITLAKALPSLLATRKMMPSVQAPSLLLKLYSTQIALGTLAIMFGSSMLVPGIVPGILVGVLLAANGGVLLYLMRLLFMIDAVQRSAENAARNAPSGSQSATDCRGGGNK